MQVPGSHRAFPALFGIATSLALFLACGHDSPSAPSPQPQLSILAETDVLHVGAFVDMRLQAVFPDGGTTMITPAWSTDRPEIVHVKPLSASKQAEAGEEWDGKTGTIDHMLFARVTGLAPGDARIIAESPFGTVTRQVHVLSN